MTELSADRFALRSQECGSTLCPKGRIEGVQAMVLYISYKWTGAQKIGQTRGETTGAVIMTAGGALILNEAVHVAWSDELSADLAPCAGP
ncbi:MAG: hypothetical protein E6H74_06265 [Betaproteobacteria bacterium]|nr:MAG: hypothetical protein E6H74_06265 [Betaproteobacteria bacterium]